MTTPWTESYEQLKRVHKVLTDSISVVEKEINQTSVEWLQFCGLVEKQNKDLQPDGDVPQPDRNVSVKNAISRMENSTLINVQPIELNVKLENSVIKQQEEEFDSD